MTKNIEEIIQKIDEARNVFGIVSHFLGYDFSRAEKALLDCQGDLRGYSSEKERYIQQLKMDLHEQNERRSHLGEEVNKIKKEKEELEGRANRLGKMILVESEKQSTSAVWAKLDDAEATIHRLQKELNKALAHLASKDEYIADLRKGGEYHKSKAKNYFEEKEKLEKTLMEVEKELYSEQASWQTIKDHLSETRRELAEAQMELSKNKYWVSVEDRLPRWEVDVLVYDGFGIYISSRLHSHDLIWDDSQQILDEVTHWMPLPKPPTP